jgi:hypothetical protein
LFGEKKRVLEALDFLALLSSHIPDKFENRILYYGHCLPPIFPMEPATLEECIFRR